MTRNNKQPFEYIGGRNTISEAMRAGRILRCFVRREPRGELARLTRQLHDKNIEIMYVNLSKLNELLPNVRHQGIIAEVRPFEYADLFDLISKNENKDVFFMLLDGIEDPHNLGAIIRTADAAGAAGVFIPERRSASVTEAVHKVSAGATEWLPIAQIGNIAQTIEVLKEAGYWVVGADAEGEQLYSETDWSGKIVIVVGNEGKGLSRLTKEKCDFLVRIPMRGNVSSLNVSVAAGLLMYAAAEQQGT